MTKIQVGGIYRYHETIKKMTGEIYHVTRFRVDAEDREGYYYGWMSDDTDTWSISATVYYRELGQQIGFSVIGTPEYKAIENEIDEWGILSSRLDKIFDVIPADVQAAIVDKVNFEVKQLRMALSELESRSYNL